MAGLAFAPLNLRWNPFGEPAPEDRAALAVADLPELRPGDPLQVVGDRGGGKTTLLLALAARHPGAVYGRVEEGEDKYRSEVPDGGPSSWTGRTASGPASSGASCRARSGWPSGPPWTCRSRPAVRSGRRGRAWRIPLGWGRSSGAASSGPGAGRAPSPGSRRRPSSGWSKGFLYDVFQDLKGPVDVQV